MYIDYTGKGFKNVLWHYFSSRKCKASIVQNGALSARNSTFEKVLHILKETIFLYFEVLKMPPMQKRHMYMVSHVFRNARDRHIFCLPRMQYIIERGKARRLATSVFDDISHTRKSEASRALRVR